MPVHQNLVADLNRRVDSLRACADFFPLAGVAGQTGVGEAVSAIARAAVEIGRRLKPKDEQILDLAFRQKRPLKEVAARLNISLSAAKSRVSRLRQRVSALARELLAD